MSTIAGYVTALGTNDDHEHYVTIAFPACDSKFRVGMLAEITYHWILFTCDELTDYLDANPEHAEEIRETGRRLVAERDSQVTQ